MIRFSGVRAKALARGTQNGAIYTDLSFALAPGCHAVVGASPAEGRLLLDLAAGQARARRGRVQALDGAPGDPKVAARTAFVPLDVVLPDGLTVLEIAALEARVRGLGAPSPAARLARLDAGWLGGRRAHSLSAVERRAGAPALPRTAAAAPFPLEVPPSHVQVGADPLLAPALRALVAQGGVCVVLTTASRRDADLAGATTWALRGERLVPEDGGAAGKVTLQIVVDDPMRLAAALAAAGAAVTLHADRSSVLIETADLAAAAETVARVSVAEGLSIVAMFRRGEESSHVSQVSRVLAEAAQRLPSLAPPPAAAEPPGDAPPAPAESAP